nr:hypothetical protein [Tanacetum cinerariifolium]
EALTALRKRARTTKTSVPSPFELLMNEIDDSKPLVKEICATCGNHDSKEKTWMMFPGTDIFVRVPFHAAHTILEKGSVRCHMLLLLSFAHIFVSDNVIPGIPLITSSRDIRIYDKN